jgi:plastocyanin
MRKLAGIAVVAVLALALGAAVTSAAPEKRGSKTVQVGDDFFNPTKLNVSPGTKVKWKWVGSDEHNVVKSSGPGGGFESPITDTPGVNLTHKFSKSGKYKIICTIHENMTMKVKVK